MTASGCDDRMRKDRRQEIQVGDGRERSTLVLPEVTARACRLLQRCSSGASARRSVSCDIRSRRNSGTHQSVSQLISTDILRKASTSAIQARVWSDSSISRKPVIPVDNSSTPTKLRPAHYGNVAGHMRVEPHRAVDKLDQRHSADTHDRSIAPSRCWGESNSLVLR